MRITILSHLVLALSLLLPGPGECELIMRTHGHITIAPYIHGFNKASYLYPGYRSEFLTHVDFFSYKGIVFEESIECHWSGAYPISGYTQPGIP